MKRLTVVGLLTAVGVLCAVATPVAAQSSDPVDVIRDRPPLLSPKVEAAIERGVRWLALKQRRDGSFSEGGGMGTYPCTMTALAGMAFLGHGDTPTRGRYADSVRRAVRYLISQAQRGGLITSASERGRSMYGHGFGMMFLAQALGEDGDPELEAKIRRVLKAAIKLTSKSQSQKGGWLYTPDSRGDEGSVTVTQVQALRACRNAGLSVPRKVVKKAVDYIEKSMQPDGGIAYRVGNTGSQPAISAAATAVLYNAGQYDSKVAHKLLKYCRKNIPVTASGGGFGHWFYTHLYLAQAYWHVGGKDWSGYYPKICKRLLQQQNKDGSWQGDGVGRVYGTGIAVTILTLPYERVPLYMR